MQDIFISTLPALLNSWIEAFPQATISATVPEVVDRANAKIKKSEDTIFWLHMNEDRQQWMANTIASIAKDYQGAKVVVLANMPNQAESVHALSLGAMGYCHAYVESAVLKEIQAVISHGGIWLGQEMLQRLIEVSTKLIGNQPEYVADLLAKLTPREKEVAVEAAKGASNKEIARILSITERTVKAHLAHTFERLGAKDRLQLALMLSTNYKR
jgi:two-component system nitrate/nitrite response regulator NarL